MLCCSWRKHSDVEFCPWAVWLILYNSQFQFIPASGNANMMSTIYPNDAIREAAKSSQGEVVPPFHICKLGWGHSAESPHEPQLNLWIVLSGPRLMSQAPAASMLFWSGTGNDSVQTCNGCYNSTDDSYVHITYPVKGGGLKKKKSSIWQSTIYISKTYIF